MIKIVSYGHTCKKDLVSRLIINFRKLIDGKLRRFNPSWFAMYQSWLEYNIEKDAAYCIIVIFLSLTTRKEMATLLLLKDLEIGRRSRNLKVMLKVQLVPTIKHSKKIDNLLNQKQSIQTSIARQSDQARMEYRTGDTSWSSHIMH